MNRLDSQNVSREMPGLSLLLQQSLRNTAVSTTIRSAQTHRLEGQQQQSSMYGKQSKASKARNRDDKALEALSPGVRSLGL